MAYIIAYFGIGIVVSVSVLVMGRKRSKEELSPLYFFFDSNSFSILVLFGLWPLWILVQLIERSHPSSVRSAKATGREEIALGAIGYAKTNLRPGGKVQIGSDVIDAVSDFGSIDQGKEVEVVERMPTGVRVRPKDGNAA